MHNRFQTADNQTGAIGGRVGNAPRDQRRFASLSSACGAAKTRPSRGTQSRQTGGGTVFHAAKGSRAGADLIYPWAVSIKKEDSSTLAFVGEGELYDGLLSIAGAVVVIDPDGVEVDEDDVVCIEYTYADDTMKIAVVPGEDFNPIIEEGAEGEEEMTKSLFPLAQIVAKEDSDPVALIVNQIVKNNLTTTLICYDGKPVKYFLAI